jgi:pimeloyl-ACP methyl ester carboxylesterase
MIARRSLRRLHVVFTACAALALAACSGVPVGVGPADPSAIQRELTSNVLNSGEPSILSTQVLQRQDLYIEWQRAPRIALATLHDRLGETGGQYRLFALAELSYAHAQDSGDRSYYLAAAVYAYTLLFPGDMAVPPLDATDPRMRVACDLYNRALAEGLKSGKSGAVEIASGTHLLPFGSLEIALEPGGLSWAGYRLEQFLPAADLSVRGLRNRYRRAGIGAPLVARLAPGQTEQQETRNRRVSDLVKVPVTAFLRLAQPRENLDGGFLAGKLEIYSQDDVLSVDVDGRAWPLEFETSSALAYMLGDSPWWDFEYAGFLAGAFKTDAEKRGSQDGLFLVHPYRPGRIPVVLVHGTASSPARWADLVNELEIDRDVWEHYQIWLYIYHTGNPIGFSAGALRQALENAVSELDPMAADPALRRMVVIGHSQGGLLTKLTAVDSGNLFWNQVSDEPFEKVRMDVETRAILHRSTFFTPEPFVKRVIFVCTPHRGSFLAAMTLGRFAASLVTLPSELTGRMLDVVTLNQGALVLRSLDKLPTSIDNMSPTSEFIQTLAALPIAPGIAANSIIAVDGDDALDVASDGVVQYTSARHAGVESEKVVRSSHSAQGNPAVIEEIRRILLVHLQESVPALTAPEVTLPERSP